MTLIPFPRPDRPRLGDLLARAGSELDAHDPPPWVAAQVHAHLARRPAVPALSLVMATPAHGVADEPIADHRAWAAAVFCVLLLAALFAGLRSAPGGKASALDDAAGRFESVVAPQHWTRPESERAWLVMAELPAQQLASLGLSFDPARAGETVRAELLLDPAGEILAVRLPR